MVSIVQKELPTIVSDGVFGENVDFVAFEPNNDLNGKDNYKSTVVFGTVCLSDESCYEVLVKFKLSDKLMCEKMSIDEQFQNEITMYEKIIPFLLAHRSTDGNAVLPSIPRYFHGRNRCGEFADDDLIILENVIPLGYNLSEERIFLDYEHLLNALRTLAKFHALSYSAKHKDPAGFQETISHVHDLHPVRMLKHTDNALFKFGKRGIDGLLRRSGRDLYRENEHVRRFDELLRNGKNALRRALEPREPFSVVCHGDFNRNNVLFRYDEAGNPVDALLFDFGTPRYGSPALDLSFLLYMNAAQTVRQSRWDDLLDAYCTTLASSVPSGVRVPGRNELDSEMAASALYGLAIASFFLPFQLEANLDWDEKWDGDQKIEKVSHCGGEAGTELVADLVQHFIDMEYA